MAILSENVLSVAEDAECPEHTLVMYIGETGRKQWICSCGAEQGLEHTVEEEDASAELDSDA